MKWLKKWGYLILMLLVGILYFSFVDEWKAYARAVTPLAEWYGEQSEKYESLAKVNEWLAGVLGQDGGEEMKESPESDGIYVAGDISGDSNTDGSYAEDDYAGAVEVPENMGNATASGENEVPKDTGSVQDSVDSDDGSPESYGNGNEGQQAGVGSIGSGTHIVIGGPESGIEMGFGDENAAEPDYQTVKDFYFADAVFIGDSRTVGMFEYGGLEEITTFYASKGLSVYDVFDKRIVEVSGQKKKITVEEALQQNSFSKIYLMLGLNEMGTGTTETFLAKYEEVLNHLQELQPDAIIYVQAIMKLTTERSGKGDQFHNPGIEERNAGISRFADNEKIFYLDVNPLICDETGGMIEEYTYDGIHLKAKYIGIWKEYLKEHAILP